MTWYQVAAVLVVATFALFAWALCRAASQGDRDYEDVMAEQRRRHYTPKEK
jgi:hypothetical protein